MYEVNNGYKTLRFEGTKLGTSSSYRPSSARWIEFTLYKTNGGSYILERVGVSLVFHSVSCELVEKYGLHEADVDELQREAIPCELCEPSFREPLVYPEKYRYWTMVSEEADAVLEALYKTDESGTRYLTNVAQRILDQAADLDPEIDAAYRIEIIP